MKKTSAPNGSANSLLSIGDVAAATAISTETLRIWERRYGRPVPVRLPSGHRRYTPAHVRWLRRVAEAIALGHRPHKVVPLSERELDEVLGTPTAERDSPEALRWVRMVKEFKGEQLVAEMMSAWKTNDVVPFLDLYIAPFVSAVGRAWADGKLEVRHEHFASELVQNVIRNLRSDLDLPTNRPVVLLTTLPGESHGIGLQMAALVCSANRVPVGVLGVDTPLLEIVRAVNELGSRVVGLSVSLATGGVETDRVIAELRQALPADVRLVVGGDGARGIRRGPRGIEYVESLAGWDEIARSLRAI